MKNFYNLNDIKNINQSIDEILDIKSNIGKNQKIFEDKIIGLIFFNPSLRTRMSTYKASKNLGLETFFIYISNNIWTFEFEDGKFNQLTYWMSRQIIDNYPLDLISPVDWMDESQDLNERVRSYLDVNCGHCHSPTGNANSTGLYLHLNETRDVNLGVYKKPVATGRGSGGLKYSIVPGKPEESILLHRMISMDPGVMMPESGRALTHEEAVEMVREWIMFMEK